VNPAVACIDWPRRGTAFAIDSRTALTAWHCVRDLDDDTRTVDSVTLRFHDDAEASAKVVSGDAHEDWALLELTTALPESLRPIPLGRDGKEWDECRCLGFPIVGVEFGYLHFTARVSGETQRAGVPLLQLEVNLQAEGLDVPGISGGPVIPRRSPDEVVGLVSRRLMNPETEEPVPGVLFACPVRLFAGAATPAELELPREGGSSPEDLAAAARAGDVNAAGRLGHRLLAAGEKQEAEPWLRQAALGGEPTAAYAMGMLIDPKGELVKSDPAGAQEALVWFRRAATGGDIYGTTTMGIRLRQHGRNDAALPWLEEAVERGADAMAAHTLARIYEDQGDRGRAEHWERFAARQGDVRAAYDLGRLLNDRGERDEAIRWLERATIDPDAVDLLRELGIEPE
jgi:Trypsin-like peptidase domain/Tetratricopeptide repeat